MQVIQKLWQDESGVVLSAEAVLLGTVGVLGAVVGLNTVSTAVDLEMKEYAGAIRSLDQSYGYVGHQSCRAFTAGSYYRQQDVQQSLTDLCGTGDTDVRAIQKHVDTYREMHLPAVPPKPAPAAVEEPTPVTPNQIPVPKLKKDLEPKVSPAPETGAK
ncbi:MAG TPA: hypothetical protein VGM98_09565 [Schlesneria sp.]|jgi:hypothetical protein